jgi:hypothetical protein
MTTALEGGEWSAARPGRTLPPGKTRYPLSRRLGGPQGRSGQVRKISLPSGFDPRIVHPILPDYNRPNFKRQCLSNFGHSTCHLLWKLLCSLLIPRRQSDVGNYMWTFNMTIRFYWKQEFWVTENKATRKTSGVKIIKMGGKKIS